MRNDGTNEYFLKREARRGDEIARRAARMPPPRKADPSVAPSTGPTFARTLAHAMNCPGPASDTRRPVNAAGATTFHLKVTSVAATAQAPAGSPPSRRRAARHQLYIERDAAVERLSLAVQSTADLPQQQAYIERIQAVEQEVELASFGNLGRTAEERAAFWAAVEESEHPARSYAVATCCRNRSPAFWRAVSDDPAAPACLKALEGPGPHKLNFKTEAEAAPVIAFADSHGETSAKTKAERAITFNPGRASRIQTRIILELPHELTAAQRLKLARRICHRLFGGGQIRYWAAIHAPDRHNDARNFHLHVVFSDRPARKVKDKSGQRVWDFTILELQEDDANRNKRWGRPCRQDRDRSFSARDWIKQTRARVAALVNDALAEAGIERRVDPRTYREMGIDCEPEPRAPAWAYSMEKRGIAAAAARPAIDAQWLRAREPLARQFDGFLPDAQTAARFDRCAHELIDAKQRLEALTAKEQWRSAVMRQNAAEADAAALYLNRAKIRSRLAPPIETDNRRARDHSLAQLATIEAEPLAEIRQQAALAAAAEARALETLATLEKELSVGAAQIRLDVGFERPAAQPVAALSVALDGLVHGAARSPSARSIAGDELRTFDDQSAALRAHTLAVAGSSALAYADLNDTVAAGQRRAAQALASPSQFDGVELPKDGGLPFSTAKKVPVSKSISDAAHHRQLGQRRIQEAVTSADMNIELATGALAVSAASAVADSELTSESIAAARRPQPAGIESQLLPTDAIHVGVDATERLHGLDIIAASGNAERSAQNEQFGQRQIQDPATSADMSVELAARASALSAASATAENALLSDTVPATRQRQAAVIESQLSPIDAMPIGADVAERLRALDIIPTTGSAESSVPHEPRHREFQRQSDVVAADQCLTLAAGALALLASGAALAAGLAECDASQRRRQRAGAAAEATTAGSAHLQIDAVSSELAPIPLATANADEELRRPQRRRDRQRTHDDIVGDQGLADGARALALGSRASLAELAIAADETSQTLVRRAMSAGERSIAIQHAQFDETTDFAASAANAADPLSAPIEEHADERPYVEYDLGGDRPANTRDDRFLSRATRDDEQVAKESDGRARKSAGADEDAERATAARRDLGGAPNPAGGYPARDLGESRSGAGRSHPEAYREMRPVSEPSSGVRGTGASSDRQAGDQPPFAGLSRGAPVSAGARRHDVQLVSANAGCADGSGRRVDQPNTTANELTAKHRLGLQQESDRLRTSASGKGIAAAVARPEPGASRSVAASSERAASKPISRPDVHTDSASSNAVNRDQTARLDSIRAEIAAGEQIAREIETIRAGRVGPPPRHAEASPNRTASNTISRLEVHTDSASAEAADRDQTARLDSIRADIAASEQVAREIEKIRAGGASPPPRNAEASPVAAPSNPISPPEVHFDIAPPGTAADRKQVTSVEPIRAEGKNSRAGSAPRQAEAVVLPAPQAPASAEPPPPAKRDGDKLAPPTKEGPIIAIGGRALNNKVLQRKPPVWGR
jgi:hypothetical protein